MTLADTLYPRRCPSTGNICLLCPALSRLIVCLSTGASRHPAHLIDALSTALTPHLATSTIWLDGVRFPLARPLDQADHHLLVAPTTDADTQVTWCAGGPIGLLDIRATEAYLRATVADDATDWQHLTAGTPPALAWWHYSEAHRADPHRYPQDSALGDFSAQPRIAAMTARPQPWFTPDLYGPGLDALHADPDIYANYQSGVVLYGDGLVDLDGQLLLPACTPLLVEQSLAERDLYHQRARRYIDALDPTAVLTAVHCYL